MSKKSKIKQPVRGQKGQLKPVKRQKKRLGLAKFTHKVRTQRKNEADPDHNLDHKAGHEKGGDIKTLKVDKSKLSLLERCKLQMSSSLLRMIDEDVYKSSSHDVPLDKEKFLAYHEAYDKVQEKWPIKPIDYLAKYIKRRIIKSKPPHLVKFADIGCGKEPLLKMKLPLKCRVVSFDIVSNHKDIKQTNMDSLPLENDSIGCAVYSLSLMACNLGNIILEGKRVLKVNGSMLIVEVSSRFKKKEKLFIMKMEKLGLKLKSTSQLEPNGYFTFFHFTKTDQQYDYSGSCCDIQLMPCIYKAR